MSSEVLIRVRKLPVFTIAFVLLGFPTLGLFFIFPPFIHTVIADPMSSISPGINLMSTITVVGGGYGLACCYWLIFKIEDYARNRVSTWLITGLMLLTVLSTKMAFEVIGLGWIDLLISLAFIGPALCVLLSLVLIQTLRRVKINS